MMHQTHHCHTAADPDLHQSVSSGLPKMPTAQSDAHIGRSSASRALGVLHASCVLCQKPTCEERRGNAHACRPRHTPPGLEQGSPVSAACWTPCTDLPFFQYADIFESGIMHRIERRNNMIRFLRLHIVVLTSTTVASCRKRFAARSNRLFNSVKGTNLKSSAGPTFVALNKRSRRFPTSSGNLLVITNGCTQSTSATICQASWHRIQLGARLQGS